MKQLDKAYVQERLVSLLPSECEHAVNGKDIANALGITYRQVKSIVQELRRTYPICSKESDGGGYWLATSDADIKECIGLLTAHRNSYDTTIAVMKSHLNGGLL